LEKAWRMSDHLDIGAVAVDFVVDQAGRDHKVTEILSFIQVITPEQLKIDGQPGVYVRRSPGTFEFREGRYWVQELALAGALGRAYGLDTDKLLVDCVGVQAEGWKRGLPRD
jgi:hypothetical protein